MAPSSSPSFCWHPGATLWDASGPLSRPAPAAGGFRCIPAGPETLAQLAEALASQAGFCISPDPLPSGVRAPEGSFFTLTGGSTATPKIIQRTMASWIASFEQNRTQFAYDAQDSIAVLGALSHSLSLYGVVEGMHLGLATHVLATLSPAQQATALRNRRIRILYATPTQIRLLLRAAKPLPDLRLILCGGGALERATLQAIEALCPHARLHRFYGAAETSFITMSTPDTPHQTQGPAYPGVTLRILDPLGQPTTKVGEVWVRSPYLFSGYAQEVQQAARWRDGFVSLGELGQLDDAGNLTLLGRLSRQVRIAEQTFQPEAIETYLASIPDLPPAAIVPIADPLRGHRLVAVLEGPVQPETATRVQHLCRDRFGRLAKPVKVLSCEQLPLLASGKVNLITLSHWVESNV